MEADQQGEITSRWDGRQKFFDLWKADEDRISLLLMESRYREAIIILLTIITRIPSILRSENMALKNVQEKLLNMVKLYERMETRRTTEGAAAVIKQNLLIDFFTLKQEVNDALHGAGLLLPLDHKFTGGETPDDVLRYYEAHR